MAGDKSDNLPGVQGIGMGTILKKLPFLSEERSYTIRELIDYCNQYPEDKMLQKIADGEKQITKGYKIMQLYSPNISYQTQQKVRYSIDNYPKHFSKTFVLKMMIEDNNEK